MAQNQKKKRSEKRQRKNRKGFRLSDEELAAFIANCEAANLDGGDLFRVRCCSRRPLRVQKRRSLDEQKLAQILGQLGKWGNNLNQITAAINKAVKKSDIPEVAVILGQKERKIDDLKKVLLECRFLIRETLLKHDIEG